MGDGWQPGSPSPTNVDLAQNTYGSYVSLIAGSLVTDDAVGFWLIVSDSAPAATARSILLTLGLDRAGGSSFSDFTTYIAAPNPSASSYLSGIRYWFPVRIPLGASVGVKGQVNAPPTVGCRVRVVLACKPRPPETYKVGSYVITYGATPSSSSGTAITTGTTAEGAWVLLGTVAAGDHPWFWQVGLSINSTSMGDATLHMDLGLGDASNKRVVISNQVVMTTSVEAVSAVYVGGAAVAAPGDGIYARAQAAGAFSGSLSAVAYGVC